MAKSDLQTQARAVLGTLKRLDGELNDLLGSIGGAIGATLRTRVEAPLGMVAQHIEPLLNLLGGGGMPMPARRGPGRPRKSEGGAASAPKRGGRRRGGRGRKANLSPEAIAEALKQSGGNKSAAARALGVSQPTFYKYLGATKTAAPKGKKQSKK